MMNGLACVNHIHFIFSFNHMRSHESSMEKLNPNNVCSWNRPIEAKYDQPRSWIRFVFSLPSDMFRRPSSTRFPGPFLPPRKFGPTAAQKHLKDILATARDQVCRTNTSCARDFCRCAPWTSKGLYYTVVYGHHGGWDRLGMSYYYVSILDFFSQAASDRKNISKHSANI